MLPSQIRALAHKRSIASSRFNRSGNRRENNMKHLNGAYLLALGLANVVSAQIVVDPSPTVLLSGRDTRAFTVPAGGRGSADFTCDPLPAGGDVFDVTTSNPAAVVSLLLPNNVEVNAANATSLGFSFTTLAAGALTTTLIPSILSTAGTHSLIILPAGSAAGKYVVKVDS